MMKVYVRFELLLDMENILEIVYSGTFLMSFDAGLGCVKSGFWIETVYDKN